MAFYKRSVFLINPSFQVKFSLIFTAVLLVSSLVYPLIFLDFFDQIVSNNPGITANVVTAKKELLLFLIPVQILFAILVFIFSVFMTHKIAGPLYKLKNHLFDIRQGTEITPLEFRKGDHFHDVAEEVSLFLDNIATNQENDFDYLEEVAAYVNNLSNVIPEDKRPVLNEISRRLTNISSRYKNDL